MSTRASGMKLWRAPYLVDRVPRSPLLTCYRRGLAPYEPSLSRSNFWGRACRDEWRDAVDPESGRSPECRQRFSSQSWGEYWLSLWL